MIINKKLIIFIVLINCTFLKAQVNDVSLCVKSIEFFGAKLDGITDDSFAISESLKELNYAYIPHTKNGVRVDSEISIKNYQKVYGEGRGSKIISYVPKGKFAFSVESIPFIGGAEIYDLSIIIKSEESSGIKIFESRNVFISNIFINGNNIADIGIKIDGGNKKGSAWNQIDKYTILKCTTGIYLTSSTKNNWSNRNYIGFGVTQSCGTGVILNKANTNRILANPQGCEIGFLFLNSKFNRVDSFEENSSKYAIQLDYFSRNNVFSGEYSVAKIVDNGKYNKFDLSELKQKKMNSRNE